MSRQAGLIPSPESRVPSPEINCTSIQYPLPWCAQLPPPCPAPTPNSIVLSNFSFQRGASTAMELFERARKLGYRALAITDECTLAGIVRAHEAANEHGLALIVGSEFRLECGLKLVLLATDHEGYSGICQLITQARRAAEQGRVPAGTGGFSGADGGRGGVVGGGEPGHGARGQAGARARRRGSEHGRTEARESPTSTTPSAASCRPTPCPAPCPSRPLPPHRPGPAPRRRRLDHRSTSPGAPGSRSSCINSPAMACA